MFKFGGWKASLNFSGPSRRKEVYENGPALSVGGAYRAHREEFFGRNSTTEPPRVITPSMVKLPASNNKLNTSKSANDLSEPINVPVQLRKSAHDVSTDPRGPSSNRNSSAAHKQKPSKDKQEKERKSAEKKRLAEQKKQEKKAMQEQVKQDKLRTQQEKKIADQQAKEKKKQGPKTKPLAPQPAQRNPMAQATNTLESFNPMTNTRESSNPMANTRESSISRTSGPPPYTESKPPEKRPNDKDITGNTSFSKPVENSSWDLISEHRSQMSRQPAAGGSRSKQVVMDLQFSFDRAQATDTNNSEV